MQVAIHTDSSGAGLFPVIIELMQHKRGAELHLRVGSWGYRSVIPRHEIDRVADLLRSAPEKHSSYCVSWRASPSRWNPGRTKIWIRKNKNEVARCYLAIFIGPMPVLATRFKIEVRKLVSLGAALHTYVQRKI